MNFKIDLNKIMTALATAFVIFLAGAAWDFQNLKSKVQATEFKTLAIEYKTDIIARILCEWAIMQKLPEASKTCHDVLKQNGR